MFRDDYGRPKNVIPLILILLVLAAAGAGVYFFLSGSALAAETAAIDAADYTDRVFSDEYQSERRPAGIGLEVRETESRTDQVYMTPLGFPIVSNSEKWRGDKLIEIYRELLANVHGEEINYIAQVLVHPGKSELGTDDRVIAGTHTVTTENYNVFFDMPALIPPSMKYNIRSQQSLIELYDMDLYDTIAEAAHTIAHEYGHHYTIYYFMQSDDLVRESDYFKLRSFGQYDQRLFFDDHNEYLQNHQWSIYEIAAEDYVQLLGSPNAKQTRFYMDIYDVLRYGGDEVYYVEGDESTVNVFPQENANIPLAEDIAGLRDYFYSFIPSENALTPLPGADIQFEIEKHRQHGHTYYDITWNKPTEDPEALYTLVCYDTEGNVFMPVKTLYGDEEAIAKVGTVALLSGTTLTTCTNAITDEDRMFKVFLMHPDGRMQSSEFFHADF